MHRIVPIALAVGFLGSIGCEDLPTGPPAYREGAIRGFSFAGWSRSAYAQPDAFTSLEAMHGTGADAVSVLVTSYQPHARASRIRLSDPRTPSPESVRAILDAANSRGMTGAVKLHIDLDDGAWRGTIEPPDPAQWFADYTAFAAAWAALAESTGAGLLMVGTELSGTLQYETAWREVIATVREVFTGELVYAASWDQAGQVPFWDALDFVGVDAYFPVAHNRDPSREELINGWNPWIEYLAGLGVRAGRPVLITEIGYRSVDGAGIHPYEFASEGTADPGEQADLYWAALHALGDREWIAGVYWWNWLATRAGGPRNRDYTPRGKPAEQVLIDVWGTGSGAS